MNLEPDHVAAQYGVAAVKVAPSSLDVSSLLEQLEAFLVETSRAPAFDCSLTSFSLYPF